MFYFLLALLCFIIFITRVNNINYTKWDGFYSYIKHKNEKEEKTFGFGYYQNLLIIMIIFFTAMELYYMHLGWQISTFSNEGEGLIAKTGDAEGYQYLSQQDSMIAEYIAYQRINENVLKMIIPFYWVGFLIIILWWFWGYFKRVWGEIIIGGRLI